MKRCRCRRTGLPPDIIAPLPMGGNNVLEYYGSFELDAIFLWGIIILTRDITTPALSLPKGGES